MSPFDLFDDPAWRRLGLALVHFVWQGILVAGVYGLLMDLFRVRRAEVRYVCGLVALGLMAMCPLITWAVVDVPLASVATASGKNPDVGLTGGLHNVAHSAAPWIVAAWLAGVCVLGARFLLSLMGIYRLSRSEAPLPAVWRQKVLELCDRLGLVKTPRLVISHRLRDALAVGFFRPLVVLPASWLTELPPDMVEAVLAHELAHIRRWDLWLNLAQRIVESVLFYHPCVWWLSRVIRTEREMCCDELAVSITCQRVTYASALEVVCAGTCIGRCRSSRSA